MWLSQFSILIKATGVLLLIGVPVVVNYNRSHNTDNELLAIERGDYSKAVTLLENNTESGDPGSAVSLGNLYRFGLGVTKSEANAAILYSQSAHGGNVHGMVNLAMMYRDGAGVEANPELAYAWFNLAREKRSPVAQLYMSEMLEMHMVRGHLVPKIKREYATLENMPELELPE